MPPPPPPRPAPRLPDELIEEIFLRLPPDEPAFLVRTSLASKFWLSLLSGARFRGRYREHHGAPPMLGFLHTWFFGPKVNDPIPHFTSTAKFGARILGDDWGCFEYSVWDCRHGRVLLGDPDPAPMALVVWDPMTGCRRELVGPGLVDNSYGAAVLCAMSGCDHRACHAGPFKVVFVAMDTREYDEPDDWEDEGDGCIAQACVSSPETGFDVWGEPCADLHLAAHARIAQMPPVLVEEALHFIVEYKDDDGRVEILKYDLRSNCLSLFDAPLVGPDIEDTAILMAMEDGSLGFAHVDMFTLYLWSRQMDSSRVVSWTKRTIIHLRNLLPIKNPEKRLRLIGSAEGCDTVFVTADMGIYVINVMSQRWNQIWKREEFHALIPYMSFHNPQERVMLGGVAH